MASHLARRTATAPRRHVLADGAYGAIKVMILEHEIAPGEHVGIDELARDLSVSPTPVREALARLESDGLVTKIPLRCYEATDLLSVQQFDELFYFRALIEQWAAAEASRRSTRLEIEAIRAELDRAQQGSIDPRTASYTAFIEHDTRFHTLVAKTSGIRWWKTRSSESIAICTGASRGACSRSITARWIPARPDRTRRDRCRDCRRPGRPRTRPDVRPHRVITASIHSSCRGAQRPRVTDACRPYSRNPRGTPCEHSLSAPLVVVRPPSSAATRR